MAASPSTMLQPGLVPTALSGPAVSDGSTQAIIHAVSAGLKHGSLDAATAVTILGNLLPQEALLRLTAVLNIQSGATAAAVAAATAAAAAPPESVAAKDVGSPTDAADAVLAAWLAGAGVGSGPSAAGMDRPAGLALGQGWGQW